jgi:hypothetical protein
MKNISAYLQSKKRFKRAIPMLYVVLKTCVGQKNAKTQSELLKIAHKRVPDLTGRDLRSAIHEIRVEHLVKGLVANNKGFYIERNKEKLRDYLSRLGGYIQSMQRIKSALAEDYNHI